jgi:hypothetical protein
MLTQLLGREGTTDLAEIGRASALLSDRSSRQAFVQRCVR